MLEYVIFFYKVFKSKKKLLFVGGGGGEGEGAIVSEFFYQESKSK